jgi:hypothetical protein
MGTRFACAVAIVAAGCAGCSADGDHDSKPPLGLGVTNQETFVRVLESAYMAPSDADCVARQAFAAGPKKENGVYVLTQAILRDSGAACGVHDWSDYDFTDD